MNLGTFPFISILHINEFNTYDLGLGLFVLETNRTCLESKAQEELERKGQFAHGF